MITQSSTVVTINTSEQRRASNAVLLNSISEKQRLERRKDRYLKVRKVFDNKPSKRAASLTSKAYVRSVDGSPGRLKLTPTRLQEQLDA